MMKKVQCKCKRAIVNVFNNKPRTCPLCGVIITVENKSVMTKKEKTLHKLAELRTWCKTPTIIEE